MVNACARGRFRSMERFYPIGVPGQPWGASEKAQWLDQAGVVKRSYADEVLAKLEPLKKEMEVEQYGALSHNPSRYPLFCVKSKEFDPTLPTALITGGVHGYETSGVQGALEFLANEVA